ncbi:uncharacterized protein [Symphalangus syndactylus]|uniref:uncharacterized protein n=1 Tax=Symphalangus syndactylus TaxID=9590 RepID=UPI003003EA21
MTPVGTQKQSPRNLAPPGRHGHEGPGQFQLTQASSAFSSLTPEPSAAAKPAGSSSGRRCRSPALGTSALEERLHLHSPRGPAPPHLHLNSRRGPAPPHLKCTTMGPVHLVPEAEDAGGIGPDAVVRQAEVPEVLHRTLWLLLSGAGAPAGSSPRPGPHPGCARAHGRTLGCRAALASPGNTCSEGSALHQPCRQHPGTPPLRPAETQ